jgi:hypothetical protein
MTIFFVDFLLASLTILFIDTYKIGQKRTLVHRKALQPISISFIHENLENCLKLAFCQDKYPIFYINIYEN